jgi:hypothetical protein
MSSKDREKELRKAKKREEERRRKQEKLFREQERLNREQAKLDKEYGKDKKCFLTTACVEYYGLPDDCYELTTLRRFRDQYMSNFEEGQKAIHEYYHIAPRIVEMLNLRPDKSTLYSWIYQDLVLRSIELISQGKCHEAYLHYKSFVEKIQSKLKV